MSHRLQAELRSPYLVFYRVSTDGLADTNGRSAIGLEALLTVGRYSSS